MLLFLFLCGYGGFVLLSFLFFLRVFFLLFRRTLGELFRLIQHEMMLCLVLQRLLVLLTPFVVPCKEAIDMLDVFVHKNSYKACNAGKTYKDVFISYALEFHFYIFSLSRIFDFEEVVLLEAKHWPNHVCWEALELCVEVSHHAVVEAA